MAWSFVAVSNVVETTVAGHTLLEPAGAAQGDLLVACIASRIASTTAVTLPSGGEWTLVDNELNNSTATNSSAAGSGTMAYCIRGASAPNYTFNHPVAPSVALGRVVAYRGVDTSSPKDTQNSATSGSFTSFGVAAGVTTTQANDLFVVMVAGGQEGTWSGVQCASSSPPIAVSGAGSTADPANDTFLERADSNTTTGADTSLAIYDAVVTTARFTDNIAMTTTIAAVHAVVSGAFKIAASDTLMAQSIL